MYSYFLSPSFFQCGCVGGKPFSFRVAPAVTYAHKAVLLPHPFNVLPKEHDFVEAVSANLQLSPSQLKLDRIGKVKKLLNMIFEGGASSSRCRIEGSDGPIGGKSLERQIPCAPRQA
eukprot:1233784-Amphidinium_carterae.1